MMKLPSKLYSYRDSSLSKFAPILEYIPNEGVTVIELYYSRKKIFSWIGEYIDVLTCLYALNIIKVNDGIITINK